MRVVATGRPDGSSPHARGTLLGALEKLVLLRFIPACAGNAGCRRRPRIGGSVHPRIRGERGASVPVVGSAGGSSPHTRGTRVEVRARRFMMRFIPAYAGNASGLSLTRGIQSVHPRIRGERLDLHQKRHCTSGSSPHTRGTPGGLAAAIGATTVHPRIRGERCPCRRANSRRSGSSPHTRGTQCWRGFPGVLARFIPAYAGNAPAGLRSGCI